MKKLTLTLGEATGGQGSSLVGGVHRDLSRAHSKVPWVVPLPSRTDHHMGGIAQLGRTHAPCNKAHMDLGCTLVVHGIGHMGVPH